MKVLFFDTETTGMVLWKERSSNEDQPHLVQIAAKMVDLKSKEVLSSIDLTIECFDWTIALEATKTHGLNDFDTKETGVSEQSAIMVFWDLAMKSDLLVAHNVNFDDRIVRAALHRYLREGEFIESYKEIPQYCTMTNLTNVVKAPHKNGRSGYKWPTLQECYTKFFGREFEGAHTAMGDVNAMIEVFFEAGLQHDIKM